MNPLTSFLLLLATLQYSPANRPAQTEPAKLYTELASLIAHHQYTDAEQTLERHLASGGNPAAACFQIGKAYFDHQEWQRSAAFLEKSLKANGTNDQAHQLLGLDWRELHRPADAEAELLEAAKQNPANRENAYLAGHQLLLNGKFAAALPYLYSALDSKSLQSQALQAIALAQARLGNYGLAESYYRKVIDSAPASDDDRYPALFNLGILLLLGHDPARLEEGFRLAQEAAKLRPDSADAHFLAGKALFKLGRLPDAAPELVRAAKLNPDDTKPHFLLAQIYEQLGQPDRARKERENLTRLQGRPGQSGMATAGPSPALPK